MLLYLAVLYVRLYEKRKQYRKSSLVTSWKKVTQKLHERSYAVKIRKYGRDVPDERLKHLSKAGKTNVK